MNSATQMDDPYKTLGVSRTATDAEIKKAYRDLAKKLHPDLNPGDTGTEVQFKNVSAAYDLLRDPERRRRFDAGEIDASGAEKPERRYYRQYAGDGAGQRYQPEGDFDDLSDLFAQAFGGQRAGPGGASGHGGMRFRGANRRYHLQVSFLEAVNGGTQRVTTPDGSVLDISIPPGVADGQTLRLAGRGEPGINDGPPGDALIELTVGTHALFERDGDNVRLELPISIDEAILGGSVQVPTPDGRVNLRIPAGSSSGSVLRLKGKGVRRSQSKAGGRDGDLLVSLKIVLPDQIDESLKSAIQTWRDNNTYDPRQNWKGGAS